MNAKRRAKLERVKENLMELIEAEEEACDNIPESLVDSERSQTLMETKDALQEAYDALEGI